MSEQIIVEIQLLAGENELSRERVQYDVNEDDETLDKAVDDMIAGHLWQPGDRLVIVEIERIETPASDEPYKPGSMPKARPL